MRRPLFASGLILLCVLPGRAESWVKVRSPHFTVISNGSEKEARRIALGFEQIHSVFAIVIPGMRTDSGAETIVIAPKDEHTFVYLLPDEKKRAGYIAGEFHKGWEKDYVIVRLDIPDENRNIVYHEYIHKLLHLNFTRLPTWLDEGLAEFFGNTLMRVDGIYIGASSPRLGLLRSKTLYPLQTILTATPNSPYYRDEDKIGMFYAESWGLTHFLMFGENMGNGQKMNAYLGALQKGMDSQKAFEQTFGNRDELEKKFENYCSRYTFRAAHLNNPPSIDPKGFTAVPMSQAETDARLGSFFTYTGELEEANQRLPSALAEDPKSSLAHENVAFLDFRQGKDEEAAKEFNQAAELNPNSYLALFCQAMMRYHGKADADSLSQLDDALKNVLRLNPRFAPAVVVRSPIYVREGKLRDGFNTAVQAMRLEPDRAGYQTNAAAILLHGHDYPEAVKLASSVASRWTASDSAEALAVVNQARRLGNIEPTADERSQEDGEMEYAKGTTAVDGIVKSVDCEKSKPMELVLQSGDKNLNFRAGKPFDVGFSDTLWYGADHFSPCHHIEGMKAVVRYTPSSNRAEEDEIRWLEVRDELIPPSDLAHAN
jgi:hypothetical protein